MTPTLAAVRPVFQAVVTTIVPEAAALDAKGWNDLEALVESLLRDRPAAMQRQVRLFLRLIQWLPVPRYGRLFLSLNPAERTRILSYLQDHPVPLVRVGFWGLRTMALLGYYGRPEAAQAIGYTASPRGWEALG
jgi:hypothetical protein